MKCIALILCFAAIAVGVEYDPNNYIKFSAVDTSMEAGEHTRTFRIYGRQTITNAFDISREQVQWIADHPESIPAIQKRWDAMMKEYMTGEPQLTLESLDARVRALESRNTWNGGVYTFPTN